MTIYVRDTRTGYKVPLVQGDDAVAAHEGAGDPHPQYLTDAEGDAQYAAIGHDHDADYANIAHTHTLNDLTDVTVNTPSTDEVLKYNGSSWVNAAISGGVNGVPYFIPSGETFTVPLYFQMCYVEDIEVEGTLDIEGHLIQL